MKTLIILGSLILCACGTKGGIGQLIPTTPHVGYPIDVQLNDTWNQVFPSESVQISDTRRFYEPAVIQVVGGAFAGIPGQRLHARIKLGNTRMCEYFAMIQTDAVLVLDACYNFVDGAYLEAGTVIELENYDAPGLLLEVHFTLYP